MADEQQVTPSVASGAATANKESAEAREREEKNAVLETVFNEMMSNFGERVQRGSSFSLKLNHDTNVGTLRNGKHERTKGWEVKFDFSKSNIGSEGKHEFNFEVDSTPLSVSNSSFPVSKEGKGSINFSASGNSINVKFCYGKTFKLLDLNEENEVAGEALSIEEYKTVNSEILEVWFPPKSESTALQRPISLSDDESEIETESPYWIRIEEGLKADCPTLTVKNGQVETNFDDWWSMVCSIVTYWTIAAVYSEDRLVSFLADNEDASESVGKKKKSEDHWGLPPKYLFEPVRPVNLNPSDVLSDLEKDKLYFPWHVIESACAALNAGKNVIFTGPPGCGKSKLASFLAKEATGQAPLMATASPAWTSGDLIGRYMPARDGNGLVFQEGFLLRAVPQSGVSKWLIIDEFNRADIDSCFGELFSVLAGDAVQLPFEKLAEGDGEPVEDGEKAHSTSFVRIIPATADDIEEQSGDYRVPRRFRLIGTMNDADRSGLNNLSFALMRRFAFIPVEAPKNDIVKKIVKGEIKKVTQDLKLDKYFWNVTGERRYAGSGESKLTMIEKELFSLFCKPESDNDFGNLISSKSVGLSIVKDVIRFAGEGMRSPGSGDERYVDFRTIQEDYLPGRQNVDRDKVAEMLVLSYLALALVLQVFPQLESLEQSGRNGENKLIKAIKHIFCSMHVEVDAGNELRMLRIDKSGDDSKYDRVLRSEQTIAEFLFENLKTRLPNLDAGWLRSELVREGWISE